METEQEYDKWRSSLHFHEKQGYILHAAKRLAKAGAAFRAAAYWRSLLIEHGQSLQKKKDEGKAKRPEFRFNRPFLLRMGALASQDETHIAKLLKMANKAMAREDFKAPELKPGQYLRFGIPAEKVPHWVWARFRKLKCHCGKRASYYNSRTGRRVEMIRLLTNWSDEWAKGYKGAVVTSCRECAVNGKVDA